MTFITVNGQQADTVSALDRGFAYGDGVFETCRVQNQTIALWSYHSQRLVRSLARLSITCELSLIESCVTKTIEQASLDKTSNFVLKIIVTRGLGARGYGFDNSMPATILCSVSELPALNPSPLRLPLLEARLGCSSALAGMKHLNRLENVLLKAECQQLGVDDGLALNELDWIVETTHSNVFFKFSDGWKTPRLNVSGVSGVMRQLIIESLMPENQLVVSEADISVEQLADVSAAFCCNSLRGISAVAAIGDFELDDDDDLRRLRESLESIQHKTLR